MKVKLVMKRTENGSDGERFTQDSLCLRSANTVEMTMVIMMMMRHNNREMSTNRDNIWPGLVYCIEAAHFKSPHSVDSTHGLSTVVNKWKKGKSAYTRNI